MQKLRFKNRGGILYFGFGDKFKSSKLKYSIINKNIIIGKFKNGQLNNELEFMQCDEHLVTKLLDEVMIDKENTLKHNSILAYRNACKNNIIPYFKGKATSDVRPIDIKLFQDSLVQKGLGIQSISMARGLLKDVFSLAIIREQINSNPIKMVDMPKFREQKEKPKPFTLDEIDIILAHCDGDVKNFLGVSFFTGMRSGEVLALKWEDVDFNTDTISINKTIANGTVNTPKTHASFRDIEMLDEARKYLKAQQLTTGLNGGYVFLNSENKVHNTNAVFYKRLKAILVELGIDERTLHNTRHTFASLMLNNGIDPLWVSHTLGHESLDITLKVYTRYMPKKEKMSIRFLDTRYKSGTNTVQNEN